VKLEVIPDGPLDPAATLARYRLWGADPANQLTDDSFLRAIRVEGRCLPYRVTWQGDVDHLRLEVEVPGRRRPCVAQAVERQVRALFGLDFDLAGFYRLAKADPLLAPLVDRLYGLRPTLTPEPLEMLAGAISAQQVNLRFACAVRARLVRRYGVPVRLDGHTVWAFPEPAVVARLPLRALRALQWSAVKARALRGVARALLTGTLDPAALGRASDQEVVERLTALYGIGRWTAEWFLARALGRGAVCPAGDLGVRRAFAAFCGRRLDEGAIRRRARSWGEYQTLAVHYLLAAHRLQETA
jgi:DNA-3-methyladenine glycosylase II